MNIEAKEMGELQRVLNDVLTKMEDGIKRNQDTIDKALEESKKEGTIHKETSEKIAELSKSVEEHATVVKGLKDTIHEVQQQMTRRAPSEGEGEKSLAETVLESPEYKQAASSGRMSPVNIKSFHRKQIFNATGQNQPLVPSQRVAGIVTPAEQRLYVRDLIPAASTTSNLIEYAVEATYTNNAGPQGGASSPAETEGQIKPESAMTFSLSNAAVVTLAHYIAASRQVLSDAAMLQGHLSDRLIYGLKFEEEDQLLNGDGLAGNISGLVTQAAAYNRSDSNDTILDTLLKALLQVSLSNYDASAFILNPIDWFNAIMLKDTQGRYLFSDPQSMVAPRVWAKPVVPTQSMTAGNFLAGAFNLGAQIWDREDATVRISENVNDHFIRNMVAILAEERLTLTVYRPTAFVYGTIPTT